MSVATGSKRGCAALATAALAVVIVVARLTPVDELVSDLVYDRGSGQWPVSHARSWLRLACYEGPKYLIILFGLCLVAGVVRPRLLSPIRLGRREAAFLLSCLALVPTVVGFIKYHSGVACATELVRYGGTVPDELGRVAISRMFDTAWPHGCWPSGHASGGFALLAFGFLPGPARRRMRRWSAGLAIGGVMGVYQVARGAHFASHIVVTALVAQLLICCLAAFWDMPRRRSCSTSDATRSGQSSSRGAHCGPALRSASRSLMRYLISAISRRCASMISSASLRTRGSTIRARSLVMIAMEWCGIIALM